LPHLIVAIKRITSRFIANFKNLSLTFEIIGGNPHQWIVSEPNPKSNRCYISTVKNAIKVYSLGENQL